MITPHAIDLLKEDINNVGFLSIAADTTNHRAVKESVSVKILDFLSLPGETFTYLMSNIASLHLA